MAEVYNDGRFGRACLAAMTAVICLAGCGGGGGGGGSITPFNLPFGVSIADLNNDGALDLAVATTFVSGAPPHSGFASAILQNPSMPGSFAHGVHYGTGSDPVAIAAGDLNGDGRVDLVVANSTSKNISIMAGFGSTGLKREGGLGSPPTHPSLPDCLPIICANRGSARQIWIGCNRHSRSGKIPPQGSM